jgi:hypothetical protein
VTEELSSCKERKKERKRGKICIVVKRKKRLKEIENGKKILLEREREIGTGERKREMEKREDTLLPFL